MTPRKVAASEANRGAPALSALGLGKRFGDRVAFEGVSFEIGSGEVFGFLGPNGAGKTTTVRTLGTLIAPTSGSATVAGIPLTPENGVEIRRRIAIMPESPGLYLRLSVAENLACFADPYEVPDPGDRIDHALQAVHLADRAAMPAAPRRGYKNFVNDFARYLVGDPDAPALSMSRARSSFICDHLTAGTPVPALLAITGIIEPESVARYARHVPAMSSSKAALRARCRTESRQ